MLTCLQWCLGFIVWYAIYVSSCFSTLVQVSSDFSIVDLDVAFAFGFVAAASMNVLTNFAVNACITWQILFIVFPFTYAARKLQVSSNVQVSYYSMRVFIHGRALPVLTQ